MIDVFFGALLAGLCIGWLTYAITDHLWATRHPNGTAVPSLPDGYVVVRGDSQPIDRHDLVAVKVLLHRQAATWYEHAYQQVLDQVAADEAADGVDDVEDAANRREAS